MHYHNISTTTQRDETTFALFSASFRAEAYRGYCLAAVQIFTGYPSSNSNLFINAQTPFINNFIYFTIHLGENPTTNK
jgi:hypothetical protein